MSNQCQLEKICGNCVHFTPESTPEALEVRQTVVLIERGNPNDITNVPVYGKTDPLCGSAGVFSTAECIFPGDFQSRQ